MKKHILRAATNLAARLRLLARFRRWCHTLRHFLRWEIYRQIDYIVTIEANESPDGVRITWVELGCECGQEF